MVFPVYVTPQIETEYRLIYLTAKFGHHYRDVATEYQKLITSGYSPDEAYAYFKAHGEEIMESYYTKMLKQKAVARRWMFIKKAALCLLSAVVMGPALVSSGLFIAAMIVSQIPLGLLLLSLWLGAFILMIMLIGKIWET